MTKNRRPITSAVSLLCVSLLAFSFIQSDAHAAPSDYFDTVQKAYIGYYQRSADPAGLLYWAGRLNASGGNPADIIEAFAHSAESQALYGTINSTNISAVVHGIYNTFFGRNAETEGLNFYVNGFNSGRYTAATIMLNVLNGAQNEDRQSINNKLSAANLFTRVIDPELDGANLQVTYAGEGDAVKGRNFLTSVTSDSTTVPTPDETTTYVRTNIADSSDPINGIPSELTISSLSTTSAAPASLLTINGSGFDAGNSAISVLFTPGGTGIPIAVPVFSASPTSINVIVPPLLNRNTGFSSGTMTVQAIQLSGSRLMTSNVIGGLSIGPLPSIPSSNAAGAVTAAWMESGLMLLQTIQDFANTSPEYAELLTRSNDLASDMNSVRQAVNSIKANPAQTVNLSTLSGNPLVLDAATVAASDRLIAAYLQQFIDFVRAQPEDSFIRVVSRQPVGGPGCVVDLDPVTGTMICDGRTYNQEFAKVGGAILPSAAAFVYGQWLSLTGSFAAAGFLAAGVSQAAVNAFQLVWAASGPYFSALASGGPAPSLKEPATEVTTTLIDIRLSPLGGLLSGILFASDLVSEANRVSSAPIGMAPAGGLVVFDPTMQPVVGSTALIGIEGFGESASLFSVLAPKSQDTSPTCTFSYSDWSACLSDNTQVRTVMSSGPQGCAGIPVLSQSCTYQEDNTCCACTFDVYCTALGWGGCWRCSNSTYSGDVCQAPYGYLTSPGACTCDPELYQVCQ